MGLHLTVTQKLWLSMLALSVVVMLPVGFALDRGVRAYYFRHNTEDLLQIGARFAQFVSRAPIPEAGGAVRAIAEITGTPLLVIDTEGIVIASSSELAGELGQKLQNPRILQALSGQPSVFLASDQSIPGSLFVTAVPFSVADQVAGAVVVFRAARDVEEAMRAVRTLIAVAAGALLALSSGVAWFLSRRLARPLIEMKDVTYAMARGDYSQTVQTGGGDEMEQLARAINDLGATLHRLQQGRRTFFANVAHELRTPLSYVQGYADALAQGLAQTPQEIQDYGGILSEEARRLGRLVNDLFELARAEEGALAMHPVEFAVLPVVQGVVRRIQPGLNAKNIHVEIAVPPEIQAFADPSRVEQILLNLLDNALRYTPEGGRIRLQAFFDAGSGGREEIGITVEDDGPGLDWSNSKIQTEIFERFHREDASRNRHLGGTGMGLAIVKSLVEAGGGRVWVAPGQVLGGAAFSFTMPKKPSAPRH